MKTFLLLVLTLLAGAGRVARAQHMPVVVMTITGRVFRADSLRVHPLPGVRVSAAPPVRSPTVQTDADGNFTLVLMGQDFAHLPDSVTVQAALFGLGSQAVRLKKAAQARALFRLRPLKMVMESAHIGPPAPPKTAPTSQQVFWPPPQCSTMQRLAASYFTKAHTLAEVDALLRAALLGASYDNLRYYYAPEGFVLVTRIEQTDALGYALPGSERWSAAVANETGKSLVGYFKALFLPTMGHFRVIAFVVTNQPISTNQPAPQKSTATSWLQQGADGLDSHQGALPYGPGYHCTALVYEFEQSDDGTGKLVMPNELSVQTHLLTSHIARGLPHPQP